MSTVPSEDYIKATKLIETFSCFFDKINTVSNNQDNNSKKFSQLKKALYENIHSPDKISENLYGRTSEVPKLSSKNSSQISFNSVEASQKDELSISQNYSKPRSFTHGLTQSGLNKNEIKQIASQDGFGDSAYEKTQLSTEYLPSTSFLALIKAASHSDMSRLFVLTSSYANIRTFSDRQQPIFTALCFGFIEQLLRERCKDGETLDQKENEFLSHCRGVLQNNNEADTMKKFYENISMSPRFHQLAISFFKQQLLKITGDQQSDINQDSFEWINNLDTADDISFYQNLTQLFKCTLRFLILSSERLVEKIFYYEKTTSSIVKDLTSKRELTIFYDKNSKSVFILYPLKKQPEEEIESSLYQKTKAKASANLHNKPPLNSDSLKSFKSVGIEFAGGSMNTIDTFSGSVTSLNDLIENKEKDKSPFQRSNSISKPQQLRKANTLNVFTASLNDCSTSFTYPESAIVRPSTDKIVPPSPHSASKDLGFSRSKTFDEEDSLTPKGKEPIPTRSGNYIPHRESSFGDLKVNGILPQNLAQKLSKEILNGKNFFLDKSHESNGRPYMSDSKPKTDYVNGKTFSMDFTSGDFMVKKATDKVSVPRPIAVPITVKSRVDRFNQTLNKNEQELINISSKYLKKEDGLPKGSGLTSIMNTYQTIVKQSKDNNWSKPSIGTALKMDN